ncbi:MAG: hypothetical protein V1716_03190 [Candidatus Uhrbacteria bacterium]
MENKFEKFVHFRTSLLKFLTIFLFGGALLLLITSLGQLTIPNSQPTVLQVFLTIGGMVVIFFGLISLFCLPILFVWWLFVRKGISKMAPAEKKTAKIKFFVGLGCAVLSAIFFLAVNFWHLDAKKCDGAECFVDLANKCDAVKWQTTDKAGMEWLYYSSPYCRFEKKLLTITGNESQEMKKVLAGQGLSCDYKQTKFDSLWINSLIFDLEPCNGELKESIAKLLLLL